MLVVWQMLNRMVPATSVPYCDSSPALPSISDEPAAHVNTSPPGCSWWMDSTFTTASGAGPGSCSGMKGVTSSGPWQQYTAIRLWGRGGGQGDGVYGDRRGALFCPARAACCCKAAADARPQACSSKPPS